MTTDKATDARLDDLEERVSALEKAPTVNSATSVLPVDDEPVDSAGNPTI